MSDGSSIGWLAAPGYRPASWNPLRAVRLGTDKRGWACERISPGCERCYAEGLNIRLGTGERYRVNAPVTDYLDHGVLAQPLHWRAPRMVFPCSMTDLFGSWVSDSDIARIFGAMAVTPQHQYVVLTKRIARAAHLLSGTSASALGEGAPEIGASLRGISWPLPNVLIGPSVEDQQRADERMPHAMVLAVNGWRVVVSYEPALGCVDWRPWTRAGSPNRISWLLLGAESGTGRRPFDPAWFASATAQCQGGGVPAFVKQGSAFKPGKQGALRDDVWAYKQFPEAKP